MQLKHECGIFYLYWMKKILFLLFLISISCGTNTKENTNHTNTDSTSFETSLADKEDRRNPDREEIEEAELASRAKEEESIYTEMGVYDGSYTLSTESENAYGNLALQYLGNKTFKFSLRLTVPDMCEGMIEDTAYVDRTQHAFYRTNTCVLHFELLGQNIEISAEDSCDKMKGDCSFSGVYQSVAEPI
jgi:hypothetical protein